MERLYSKPPCARCQQLKGERFDPEDCKVCVPDSLPENEDAHRIFWAVRKQYIMSWNGPIDINHEAIHKAMDLYEIKDKKDCFEKVTAIAEHIITMMREKVGNEDRVDIH